MAALSFEIGAVLLDIEGTISSTAFVRDVLFAYSRQHLPAFVAAHEHERETASILAAAAALSHQDDPLAALIEWQRRDEKAPPLKAIQGLIWESGYSSGAFRSPIFADALAALRRWGAAGLPLFVYSSGSLKAQELFFRHNEAGDLRPLFSGHFDTGIGAKTEPDSYQRIARSIGALAPDILFLSDDGRELAAARATGFQIAQVVREATPPDARFPAISDFSTLDLAPLARAAPPEPRLRETSPPER
jgi:enolase-phosphatase E1